MKALFFSFLMAIAVLSSAQTTTPNNASYFLKYQVNAAGGTYGRGLSHYIGFHKKQSAQKFAAPFVAIGYTDHTPMNSTAKLTEFQKINYTPYPRSTIYSVEPGVTFFNQYKFVSYRASFSVGPAYLVLPEKNNHAFGAVSQLKFGVGTGTYFDRFDAEAFIGGAMYAPMFIGYNVGINLGFKLF